MASVEAPSAAITKVDARPVLPVSDDTALARAVALRDRFAAVVAEVLQAENVRADVLKSEPGNYPAWLRLEAWVPIDRHKAGRHERVELELIVEARPFNRQDVVCAARVTRGKRTLVAAERARFGEHDLRRWTRFAIGRGAGPAMGRLRDSLSLIVPPLSPRHNPLDRRFRPSVLGIRTLIVAAGCLLVGAGLAVPGFLFPIALALAAATLVSALLVAAFARRPRLRSWVVPQPREAPRHLGHVDSWHAVLVGLGEASAALKRRLVARLERAPPDLLEIRSERYGYFTPNGYEERERIVISHRQGHVHVHIHPLGDHLFVGWQALLNWAQWGETAPLATMEVGRASVAFHDIRPTWYQPSEFDLIDLNSLSALVHGAVEHAVKGLLKEHALDQEVDFEVMRGDRDNALDQRKAWPERSNGRARRSNVIFGSAAVRRAGAGEMRLAPIKAKGRRPGLAAIPPVILLPVVAALGYAWLHQAEGLQLFQFRQEVAPGFPFSFLPMFHLPFAAALGLGLWLYAGVRLVNALLVIALVEASTFCVGYGYSILLSHLIVLQDLRDPSLALAVTAGATALSSVCYLLAASIWAPGLRTGARWLAGLVLWTMAAGAASMAIRELRPSPLQAVAMIDGVRVFMALCMGFWLWRDELAAVRVAAARLAQQPAPARPAMHAAAGSGTAGDSATLRRALIASTLAATLAWYDFFLYGIMAGLVLGRAFFPVQDPSAATLAALSIYLTGIAARPLGAVVFGHFGDRIGRKSALVAALLCMAIASFLIALLPSYAALGVAAPAMLTALRALQGIGLGGVWGGSVLLPMEWSPTEARRGLIASLPQIGMPAGLLLANLGVVAATAWSGAQFVEWGWRIPFACSPVLAGLALWMRVGIPETPVFGRIAITNAASPAPARELIWSRWHQTALSALLRISEAAPAYVFTAFIFAYGIAYLRLPRELILQAAMAASGLALFAIPLFGHLSDRIGRKRTYMAGAVAVGLFGLVYFRLLDTGAPWAVVLAVVASSVVLAIQQGPEAALIAEAFAPRLRYSGASLSYQLAGSLVGGFAPLIVTELFAANRSSDGLVLFIAGCAAVGALAAALLPDRTGKNVSRNIEYER